MKDHHDADQVSSAMDYQQHEATYRGFITLSKWSIGVIAVTLVILYFLVQP